MSALPIAFDFAQNDPFTLTYQQILSILNGFAPLQALVGANNVEDLSTLGITTLKPLIGSSDTNALKLLQKNFKLDPIGNNSMMCGASCDYALIITTDLLRVVPINQVVWSVYRALIRYSSTIDANLGLPFVCTWNIAGGEFSLDAPIEAIQAAKRWAAILTITVNMDFPSSTL